METNEIVIPGSQLKKLFAKKYEPIIEKYDLRPVEIDILVFLYKQKNADTAKDIIQRKHLSKAHVSKSVDNLRERGFIKITEDEEDRRILHICLTEESDDVVEMALSVLKECRDIMQSGVSREDIETTKRVLHIMAENISKELE